MGDRNIYHPAPAGAISIWTASAPWVAFPTMDSASFAASVSEPHPPANLSPALQALWHDAKGSWDKAHELSQRGDERTGAWVHAYLHRKEGDEGNARYWYARAGKPFRPVPLETEWREIAAALLEEQA